MSNKINLLGFITEFYRLSIILVPFDATNGSEIMIQINCSIHCDLILTVVPLSVMLFTVIFRCLSMSSTTKRQKMLSLSLKKS